MHLEQRLELIDSLPSLPAVKTPAIRSLAAQPTIDLSKPNATIGEEMMNLFMADIAEQNRKDVNNCKQLVQNAATKRYDPKKELHQWYKVYTETMEKLGWIIQASQIKQQTIKRSGLTMDVVAVLALQGLVGANAPKLAEVAAKAVGVVKNDDGLIDIYNRKADVGSDAKFDMSPIWQTKEGYPMMILNCNSLDVSESSRGILFWKSTSQQTKIQTAAQAMYLNLDIYAGIRQLVLQKIGDTARNALADIPDLD